MTGRPRTDWIVLLPRDLDLPVDDMLVLGGSEEMAEHVVACGVARAWRRKNNAATSAPLVVAWSDAEESVDEIASLVGGDGVLVLEVDRKRRGWRGTSLFAVTRRLAKGGPRVTSAHLVQPSFERPKRYVPVDHAEALSWYARALFAASTLRHRAAKAVLRGIASSRATLPIAGWIAPRLSLVAIGEGRRRVSGRWPAMSSDGSEEASAIVLTSGFDAASRTIVLPFAPGAAEPSSVVKVATSTETAAGTIGEHRRLADLHQRLPGQLSRALPQALATASLLGRDVCIQSCAPGGGMEVVRRGPARSSRRSDRQFDAVADWLIAFGVATQAKGRPQPWTHVFRDAAQGARPQLSEWLRECDQVVQRTEVATVAVEQHWDAGPWNIYVDQEDRPFFVDWETDPRRPADSMGPPLADLVYFATYWYMWSSGADSADEEVEALLRLFAEPTPSDRDVVLVRNAIDRALIALDLDRSCVPAIATAVWAERMLYLRARGEALGLGSSPLARRADAFLDGLVVLHEDAQRGDWWRRPVGTRPTVPQRSVVASFGRSVRQSGVPS